MLRPGKTKAQGHVHIRLQEVLYRVNEVTRPLLLAVEK
jgi:hypothetical protein